MKSDDINSFLERIRERIVFWFKQGDNEGAKERRKAVENIARLIFVPSVVIVFAVAFVYSKVGSEIGSHREAPRKLIANKTTTNDNRIIANPPSTSAPVIAPAAEAKSDEPDVQIKSAAFEQNNEEKLDDNVKTENAETNDRDLANNSKAEANDPIDVEAAVSTSPEEESPQANPSSETEEPSNDETPDTGTIREGEPSPNELPEAPLSETVVSEGLSPKHNTHEPLLFPAIFPVGSEDFHINSNDSLEALIATLQSCNSRIHIIGHSDNTGGPEVNYQIGLRRANNVKDFLIRRGIPTENTEIVSRGDQEPVGDNSSIDGRAQNRRVVILCD